MAKFRGPSNLNLGGAKPWAVATFDTDARDYVVEVTGEDLKKFRAVAADYGFSEEKSTKADKDD